MVPTSLAAAAIKFLAPYLAPYLALGLAGQRLGLAEANLATRTAPLPGDRRRTRQAGAQARSQPWDRGALLPVRVILRDFVAQGCQR